MTTAVQLAQSVAPGVSLGFKNRIINGDMRIDQRNAGASQSITSGVYTVDRWKATATGGTVTGQRVSGGLGQQYNYRFTGGSGVTGIYFEQRIEAANSQDLAGNTVTLSLNTANSLLTTVTWYADYANSTDNFSATTSIGSGTITVNSTLSRYSVNINIPVAATTGIVITLFVGAQTSGTWTIGGVQLEKGSTATSFDYRPYGTELALCQRYYEVLVGDTNGVNLVGTQRSSTNLYSNWQFKVQKRAQPTISLTSAGSFPEAAPAIYPSVTHATLNAASNFYLTGTAGSAILQAAIEL